MQTTLRNGSFQCRSTGRKVSEKSSWPTEVSTQGYKQRGNSGSLSSYFLTKYPKFDSNNRHHRYSATLIALIPNNMGSTNRSQRSTRLSDAGDTRPNLPTRLFRGRTRTHTRSPSKVPSIQTADDDAESMGEVVSAPEKDPATLTANDRINAFNNSISHKHAPEVGHPWSARSLWSDPGAHTNVHFADTRRQTLDASRANSDPTHTHVYAQRPRNYDFEARRRELMTRVRYGNLLDSEVTKPPQPRCYTKDDLLRVVNIAVSQFVKSLAGQQSAVSAVIPVYVTPISLVSIQRGAPRPYGLSRPSIADRSQYRRVVNATLQEFIANQSNPASRSPVQYSEVSEAASRSPDRASPSPFGGHQTVIHGSPVTMLGDRPTQASQYEPSATNVPARRMIGV